MVYGGGGEGEGGTLFQCEESGVCLEPGFRDKPQVLGRSQARVHPCSLLPPPSQSHARLHVRRQACVCHLHLLRVYALQAECEC